jgi:hypothetical protein
MNFAVEAGVVSGLPTAAVDLGQLGLAAIAALGQSANMSPAAAAAMLGLSSYSGLATGAGAGDPAGQTGPGGMGAGDVGVQAP